MGIGDLGQLREPPGDQQTATLLSGGLIGPSVEIHMPIIAPIAQWVANPINDVRVIDPIATPITRCPSHRPHSDHRGKAAGSHSLATAAQTHNLYVMLYS